MRKLLCLLIAMLLLGKLEAAHACVVGMDNYELSLAQASTVFVGHIVRTEEAGTIRLHERFPPETVAEATFRALGVLKGQPPADGKVRFRANGYCNVELLAGATYAIFLYGDNLIRGHNEGLTRLWHIKNIDAQRLLEQLHEQREEWAKLSRERARGEGKKEECWKLFERPPDEEKVVANAGNIVVGHLMHVEEVEGARSGDAPPTRSVDATFRLLEVLKGQAPPDGKVRISVVATPCRTHQELVPSLVPGNDYLLFVDRDSLIRDPIGGLRIIFRYENSSRFLEHYRILIRKAQQEP